jgi:hypothetical protein
VIVRINPLFPKLIKLVGEIAIPPHHFLNYFPMDSINIYEADPESLKSSPGSQEGSVISPSDRGTPTGLISVVSVGKNFVCYFQK